MRTNGRVPSSDYSSSSWTEDITGTWRLGHDPLPFSSANPVANWAREGLAKEGLPTPEIREESLKEVWSKYSSPADYLSWDMGRTLRTLIE